MDNDDIHAQKDHGSKRKTPFQLQSLENFYSEDKYPKQKAMEEYAASLNLTYNQIRIWFVERRRKERKENEVPAFSKKNIPDSYRIREPHCSSVRSYGEDMYENNALFADRRRVGQKDKLPVAAKNKNRSSGQREIKAHRSKSGHPHTQELTHLLKKYCKASSNGQFVGQKDRHKVLGQQSKNCGVGRKDCEQQKPHVRLQVLFSKDYILKRVFRKDGPPLGVEFDPLPARFFCADSENLHSSRDGQRITKRRKVGESPIQDPGSLHGRNIPAKKYGIGKGLMTVWLATNSNHGPFPGGINAIDERAQLMPFRSNASSKEYSQVSKGPQQLKLVPKQKTLRRKLGEKRKPPKKKREVPHGKDKSHKKPHPTECKLSVDNLQSLEQSNALMTFIDDEELELRELQAASNPLRCSAHLASDGRHGCPLCKDFLARFPPLTVKMKLPFSTRPWDSSPELVKKLFKVLRFVYRHATTIEVYPFTLDEFAQAFHDKDSLLLGKIHVALLKMLLLDVEREINAVSISRASKDCRFLGFLHFVREQEFDVNFWGLSLNPLTWTEILRQVLIAAGFGAKNNSVRREMFSKERNRMVKYGLRPRTLKGELFTMLFEKGSSGFTVSELAKTPPIVALDLPNTTEELEQLISSTLSSDITLFEKIASSAYRLRIDPHIKGKEDSESDTEDSGSVDDEDVSRSSSSDESDDFEELNSAKHDQRIVKYKTQHKTTGQKVIEHTEIDESYSGEGWVLGLMEGEYSYLSIEEKLDALVALVDLAGAGCSLRMEEPVRAITDIIPDTRYHGSGAKVKKALANHQLLTKEALEGHAHGLEESHSSPISFPIGTYEIFSKVSKNRHSSARIKNTDATEESGHNVHPLQSIYLGSDRRYNSYWLFLGPCNANDPGHRRVYFESSEDGHWEVIDTAQALRALLSVLDCRGSRESRLCASLETRGAVICQAMDDYMTADIGSMQTLGSDPSDVDHISGDGSSPISDIDNILLPTETTNSFLTTSGAIALEIGNSSEEKKQKWDRLQAFDKWIWECFYSNLNTVKNSKRSFMDSLARCGSCHDLYWRDEKHCKICHNTFEVDFDLEERYAIHAATCRETDDSSEFPKHKVLPSQLQALKAAIHAIEMGMPEAALVGAWRRSGHKLWVKRLRRTSSLPELLQVLTDFVGAINEEWLYEFSFALGSNTAADDVIVYFQTMPQTTSAVALWMVKLDMLIAPHLERLQSEKILGSIPQSKRRRPCTR